jgi:hypothetical protein
MDNTAEAKRVETQYQEQLQYKKAKGYTTSWPLYERFKAGDQWPPPTEKTKHLPRPVFNVIRYVENHKVSSVMNENVKMVFSTQEYIDEETAAQDPELQRAAKGAELFTKYSDTTWENIKQDELNEEALESASNLGTGIWHYYWDNYKKGGLTKPYIGELCGETIDPMNIFFGNPQQKDVQKQPYIIVTVRDLVINIKKEAEENKVPKSLIEMIKPNKETRDEGYDNAQIEVNDDSKATVIIKYWKKDGKIFFMRVCSGVVIKPETATNRKLYPIAVIQWERRKKSIYGLGDTEGIIPNQKGINFLMAMQLLSVQLTGWPKLKYTEGALLNEVTNAPGEHLEYRVGGNVEYMTPGSVSSLASNLVEAFMDHTKTLSSANDAATGDMGKGEMNATAIMLLQKANGVPIESIKKRFYRAMEDVGQIWQEFWKVNYNTTRRISIEDDEGNDTSELFNGSDYADIDMNLKIDIGPSSMYSEELMMSSLDRLLDGKYIDFNQYLQYVPRNVIPFKDRLLKDLEKQQEEQMMMQQQQMQEQQAMANQEAQMPQDIDIQAALKQLSPEEQKAYQNAPPEVKEQIIQQMLQATAG